jgi:hypothetical protein
MTMTKGQTAGAPSPTEAPPERRTHIPGDGTAHAAAVERARRAMLDDARPRNRTRIGADVVCEALLLQGVDVFFSYPSRPRPPRAGRRARRRWLRAGHR